MNMTLQEKEHWDHEWWCQSEAQNCLAEARMNVPADAKPIGSGPFQIKMSVLHYCKATDAIAGSYVLRHWCFETEEELNAKEKEIFSGYIDSEDYYKIINPNKVEVPRYIPEEDDIPF
jgi:hypothetical protein